MDESLTAKGRDARARIVEAAAHLMHLRGMSDTSLGHILELADAGKGQLYHYFENRGALETAVLEYHIARQPEAASPGNLLSTWEDLERWFEAVYRTFEMADFRGGCPLGSMAAEVADRNPDLRSKLDAAFAVKRDHLARGFDELKAAGVLRPKVNPESLAEFVVATIQGGLMLARVRQNGQPLRRTMKHALDHCRSFRTDP